MSRQVLRTVAVDVACPDEPDRRDTLDLSAARRARDDGIASVEGTITDG